jgi:hypothetical protein
MELLIFTVFQATTDEAVDREVRHSPLYGKFLGGAIGKTLPLIGQEVALPAVKEITTFEYGGVAPYPHLPAFDPTKYSQVDYHYGFPSKQFYNYPAFEGPYSPEYSDFLNLYKKSGYYGLPSVVEKVEEIVVEKPISAPYYGYPKHFGLPPVVEKIEEIVIEKPISAPYYGQPSHFGLPKAVEKIEEIVIEKPISTGYYGHPTKFGFPTVVEDVKEIVVDAPILNGHLGYPAKHGYPKLW